MDKYKLKQEKENKTVFYLYDKSDNYICLVNIPDKCLNTDTHYHIKCELVINKDRLTIIKQKKGGKKK